MDIFRMDAFSGCGFFSVVVTNSGSAGTVGKELAFLFLFRHRTGGCRMECHMGDCRLQKIQKVKTSPTYHSSGGSLDA